MSAPREDREVGRWPRAWGSYGQWTRGEERNPYWSGRGSYSCQTHDERKGIREIDMRGILCSRNEVRPPSLPGSTPHRSWVWSHHAGPGLAGPAVAQTCPASSLHLEVLPGPAPYSPDHVRLPRPLSGGDLHIAFRLGYNVNFPKSLAEHHPLGLGHSAPW